MGSWTCDLCDIDSRWPTKDQAMEHIREKHLDSLIRAALERSSKEPNEDLDFDVQEAVTPD